MLCKGNKKGRKFLRHLSRHLDKDCEKSKRSQCLPLRISIKICKNSFVPSSVKNLSNSKKNHPKPSSAHFHFQITLVNQIAFKPFLNYFSKSLIFLIAHPIVYFLAGFRQDFQSRPHALGFRVALE